MAGSITVRPAVGQTAVHRAAVHAEALRDGELHAARACPLDAGDANGVTGADVDAPAAGRGLAHLARAQGGVVANRPDEGSGVLACHVQLRLLGPLLLDPLHRFAVPHALWSDCRGDAGRGSYLKVSYTHKRAACVCVFGCIARGGFEPRNYSNSHGSWQRRIRARFPWFPRACPCPPVPAGAACARAPSGVPAALPRAPLLEKTRGLHLWSRDMRYDRPHTPCEFFLRGTSSFARQLGLAPQRGRRSSLH